MTRRIVSLVLAWLLAAGPAAALPDGEKVAQDWQPLFHLTPERPDPPPVGSQLTDADRLHLLRDVQDTLAVDDYLSQSLAFRLPTPQELIQRLSDIRNMGLAGAGLAISDLQTGVAVSQNGDQTFFPASIIKLAVMVAAFGEIKEHRLAPDTEAPVSPQNVTGTWVPPGDRRPLLRGGQHRTVYQLLDLMISRSDNVATNCLIDLLGAATINRWMRRLGYSRTQVHHKLGVGGSSLDTGSGVYRNIMTANETGRILAEIYRLNLIDADASRQMLELLGRQMDRSKIPALLPPGTRVYNKTGETNRARHDAGIVEYRGHPYVLVVFTTGSPDRQIAVLAQLIHRLLVR